MAENTIVRFEDVSFEHGHHKQILDEVSFPIRRGGKITLMGQNGAGKSTLFGLITGALKPEDGTIHIERGLSIALSRQVIPRDELKLTVREFFQKVFPKKMYDIDPRIDDVLEVVHLKGHEKVHDRMMSTFSGGQQARLLLASALIQKPDLLLLDEPTNNLDKAGIVHLTKFLVEYEKTVIVISHDADFLNAFTHGVLYLDVHTHKVEQYVGNYSDVVLEISARVEKEAMKNAQMEKIIIAKKEKANYFAMKGGQLRLVAKRMRAAAAEAEEAKVEVRKEDKTIKSFHIPCQPNLSGELLHITSFKTIRNYKAVIKKKVVSLRKNQHLLLKGPNGIGKSTLLGSLANGEAEGATITKGVKVGYYRQDFSNLDFNSTVYEELAGVMAKEIEGDMRHVAAGFLITGDLIQTKVGHLSEGQKGLVAFARLVLMKPGLLILDEPTNHINFRHLPVIAKALNEYDGAMILVSHVPEFVAKIRIDDTLDLEK
ncbi:hypothetical protein A3D71_00665 [Candidatus Kaiserbacteria bacterium RIFCSPHIGHO2_02_FULL_55_20]|uniref:ABC transporter domain-containing protein n=1 Tax=Candidatus Kaiserbacteria bacterium RIFCSPHIGHO2_02_FULL_55_20 TaxID=1798497 RepID=A0A1F6DWZ2_9BACT|nr:MAG: hypothetical protein A2680_00765 [Candidatus Kaiserbacteria bacterium RIFCSPHIGHO2_01_FULL_55_37]OGG65867.1 MAG: hypothetical protein A3D71_00665 [Candidatus Kaiserbacteria bacterium RIFCSPHIGHO2_02_FULL_55_20]